nr:hypothetical protein [Brucella intermedia]
MGITINRDSFNLTDVKPLKYKEGTYEVGTISAVFGGRVQTVEAVRYDNGDIALKGFVGHYRTSRNPWRASVLFRDGASDKPYVNFGRDDRSGRFNKSNMISYEPETYRNI